MATSQTFFALVTLGVVSALATGCASSPDASGDGTGEATVDSRATGLAALPDGTYRIPATSSVHVTSGSGACTERVDVYVVTKAGKTFTVASGPHITIHDPVATGDVATGHLHGRATYDPCSYCQDSLSTVYEMDGELTYANGKLDILVGYTGGWVQGRTWSGSISTTTFGETVLPAGTMRATLAPSNLRLDGCPAFWSLTVTRDAEGHRMISLPGDIGDVDITPTPGSWSNAWSGFGCGRRAANVSVQATSVSVSRGSCSDTFTLPAWFTEDAR